MQPSSPPELPTVWKKGSLSSFLIKVIRVLHLFKLLFYRHLPKTGSTSQWEETGQVTECWPWSPLPLWSWLWAGGFWEQGLSGEPDLERPADVLPRWASSIGIFLQGSRRLCISQRAQWMTSVSLCATLESRLQPNCICSARCSSSSNTEVCFGHSALLFSIRYQRVCFLPVP